jgi:hypothetical protein
MLLIIITALIGIGNYQIVATDTRDKNMEILEMIYIKKFKDSCVNHQVESEALTTTYDNIICS